MAIIDPATAVPRCQCIVDLLSRVQRPYLFLVTVWGEYPHAHTRKYHVRAGDEDSAAHCGIQQFVKDMTAPGPIRDATGFVFERARLQ